jgi:hypothetical protein
VSQHYPNPHEVAVPVGTRKPTKRLKKYIDRDGLIVPILVTDTDIDFIGPDRHFSYMAADTHQGERVLACRELGFETILVETDWTEDDL